MKNITKINDYDIDFAKELKNLCKKHNFILNGKAYSFSIKEEDISVKFDRELNIHIHPNDGNKELEAYLSIEFKYPTDEKHI